MKSQREATWHSAWQTVYTQWKLSKVLSLFFLGFLGGSVVEDPPVNAGDTGDLGSIPGSWRAPGEGNGNPPQYSCLGNPMDRGAWRATAHGVAKSWTELKQLSTHSSFREIVLNWGKFYFPAHIWQNLVTVLVVTIGEALLASNRWWSGKLWNNLRHTGQPPRAKNDLIQ